MTVKKQVNSDHYEFKKYVNKNHRWVSYWHQIDEILDAKASSVLEVGAGAPVLKKMISIFSPEISYKILDIAEDLNPDYVGSVTDIPVDANVFDIVCAFQILEHIPYDEFESGLKELSRVSKKRVLISLPHFGPAIRIFIKIPLLPDIKLALKIPYPIKHRWNGEHYWEIGKKNYSPNRIRKDIRKHFVIVKEYIPFENQCHRFYILEKKSDT